MRQTRDRLESSHPSLLAHPVPAFLLALTILILAAASVRSLLRRQKDRELLTTGAAQWIWLTRDVPKPAPLRFYASREFALPRRPPTARARLFVDRRWALRVNGARLGTGEQRPGDPLALVEIASALAPGENRIVIEAESPTGIGGILFSLDLPNSPNAIVSDDHWRVARSREIVERGEGTKPAVWGRPPMHPWGYPRDR